MFLFLVILMLFLPLWNIHILFSFIVMLFLCTGKVNVMPFGLRELVPMTAILRDVTIGVIDNIYPDSITNFDSSYLSAMRSVGARSGDVKMHKLYPNEKWVRLLKVGFVHICYIGK